MQSYISFAWPFSRPTALWRKLSCTACPTRFSSHRCPAPLARPFSCHTVFQHRWPDQFLVTPYQGSQSFSWSSEAQEVACPAGPAGPAGPQPQKLNQQPSEHWPTKLQWHGDTRAWPSAIWSCLALVGPANAGTGVQVRGAAAWAPLCQLPLRSQCW